MDMLGFQLSTGLIGFLIFVGALWIVLYTLRNRLGEARVEVQPPILLVRTKRFLRVIEWVANRGSKGWRMVGTISLGVALLGVFLVSWEMLFQALVVKKGGGVTLVIPGTEIFGVYFPLHHALVGLTTVLVVHEFAHGVIARAQKIPLESTGFVLIGPLPGAFVEPNEDRLRSSKLLDRLRLYSVGSVANFVLAIVAIQIVFLSVTPVLDGVYVSGVLPGSPAEKAGLSEGMVITHINGVRVHDIYTFSQVRGTLKPGEEVVLRLQSGEEKTLTMVPHPENPELGYIGIYPTTRMPNHLYMASPISLVSALNRPGVVFDLKGPLAEVGGLAWGFVRCLAWIYLLNLGIGLMNLLPLPILDGGQIVRDIVERVSPPKLSKPLRYGIYTLFLSTLILNLAKGWLPG